MKFFLGALVTTTLIVIAGCGSKDNGNGAPNPMGSAVTSSAQVQGHWVATSFVTSRGTVAPDGQGYMNESLISGSQVRNKYYMSIDPTYLTYTTIDDQGDGPQDKMMPYTFQGNAVVGTDDLGQSRKATLYLNDSALTVQRDDNLVIHYNKISDADYATARNSVVPAAQPANGSNLNYPNVPNSQQAQQQQPQQALVAPH